ANTPITITGTDFLQGSTTLNTGGGVTTNNVTVLTPTSLSATFNTTNVLGSRTVSVTTPAGISNELTYKAYGPPDLGGVITPGSGAAGETVGVDILVAGPGNLVPGQTTFFTNQGGITVTNVDVYSGNNARVTFVIAPDAPPGGRTFQWQTPFGVTTNTAGLLDFVVNPP